MKKKIIIISLSALLVIGLLIIITRSNKKIYTDIDGVKYAITVNGASATSFPSGNYKVDVDCTNADAYWNSITRKVIIKNIKGNIDCNISFNSITSSDNLNTYLTSLSGTTQGEGKFVHEIGETPDFSSTSIVTTYQVTPVYFQNTSASSTTQTNVDNYWTYSNGTFTSVPSKFTFSGTNNYYHAKIQIPDDGYYQICYNIGASPDTSNILYFYKNGTYLTNIKSSTSSTVSGCYNLGFLLTTNYLNISELGYSGTSSPVITFRIEKANGTPLDTGYRYEGENPNNYILFNNELWRIIGVFSTQYDSSNSGTANATGNLVKIIREDSIGNLAWEKSNKNDWPNSTLYHLLNEQYYDWNTNKANVSTYCLGYKNLPSVCDYSIKGIQDGYRGMVVNANWYLGGGGKTGYTTYTADSIYRYERDANAIYTGRSASTVGYIGLMYRSDYLYAALASDCARTTIHGSIGNASCDGKDWLYGKGHEWTISPYSNSPRNIWTLNLTPLMETTESISGYGVRPTLYLSPNVYKVSGTGTITDPYIIGKA